MQRPVDSAMMTRTAQWKDGSRSLVSAHRLWRAPAGVTEAGVTETNLRVAQPVPGPARSVTRAEAPAGYRDF
jgi:hypothetical protein